MSNLLRSLVLLSLWLGGCNLAAAGSAGSQDLPLLAPTATDVRTKLARLERQVSIAVVNQRSQSSNVNSPTALALRQQGLNLWAEAPNQQLREMVLTQLQGWGLLDSLPGWNPAAAAPLLGPPVLPSAPNSADIQADPNLNNLQQPLVVHFWADWCGPCRHELPQLAQFYAEQYLQLRAAGIGLVTVNNDPTFNPADSSPISASLGQLPVVHDPEFRLYRRLAQRHGIALPATFLLRPDQSSQVLAYGPMQWLAPGITQELQVLASQR